MGCNLRLNPNSGHGGVMPRAVLRAPAPNDSAETATPSKPTEYGSEAVVEEKIVKAEFIDAVPCPIASATSTLSASIATRAKPAIDRPRVEATLGMRRREKLAVGSGLWRVQQPAAGRRVPIKILVQHAPAYASVTLRWRPSDCAMARRRGQKLQIESPAGTSTVFRLPPERYGA